MITCFYIWTVGHLVDTDKVIILLAIVLLITIAQDLAIIWRIIK